MRITVVGMGADGWAGLSGRARAAVEAAEVLIGGARHLELVPGSRSARVPWPSPLLPGLDRLFAEYDGRRICVLASGDPMLSGIGTTLARRFEDVEILPSLSSPVLARARLKWSAESTEVISVVGRSPYRVNRALAPGARLLVLSEDATTPAVLAAQLTEAGYGPSRLTVLEELGGPAERQVSGIAENWTEPAGAALNLVAIECETRGEPLPRTGLPDNAFEHDGQLTKRDIRAVTLARLAPLPGELLWDVGAGSGSIAIEWSRAHPDNRAIAIERDPERAARITRNAQRLGVPEVRVVVGSAPDALDGLPAPDAVFVGGGVTAEVLDACLSAPKVVANGVTLETETVLAGAYARHGGDLIRLAVEQAAPLGGFTGWTPARTVTQWSFSR
ncbi:precorrin-6y C5,15-methyltransferase (decarboxylating) subunit CbiE [Amycolatopsis magusensis]|uniref:Precorrin-6Y C5,15-methyltransferase (Decarboxylating) n=1 Tax=Amycolatopsis magusensis TaxID=882444 RepID=A0ABS4PRG4_9PSEU|nr:precorrin-6y C5,15-methyltransferase (decarboxylating) subunit CbiE [Amycolatopsis magusensis]MBP2182020.1 precorrin-6Y C5,15-methyltransferase (decarboxylating) [Amycolatopsis magusensis]